MKVFLPASLSEVVLDSEDFKTLATFVDRLAESKQREAVEKERQKEIFEDATNAMSYKDMKKSDVTKVVKACYEMSKTLEKHQEMDTLVTLSEEIESYMQQKTV